MISMKKVFSILLIFLLYTATNTGFALAKKELRSPDPSWFEKEVNRFKSYPHLDMAYRLIKKQEHEKAIAELEKYLKITPGDLNARLLLMYEYYNTKKYSEAISQANIILEKEPHNTKALICRAFCYDKLGQANRALDDFQKAIASARDESSRSVALKHSAFILAKQNKYEKLLKFLENLPEKQKNKDLFLLQAEALAKTGDRKAAITILYELSKKHPRDSQLLKKLAIIANSLGESKTAIEWIRKSISLNPHPESKLILANFLVQQKREKEALEVLNSIKWPADTRELSFEIAAKKGNIAFKLGDLKTAELSYRQALRVKADVTIYRKLANTLEKEKKPEEAETILLKAANLSGDARDWLALGYIQASLGKYHESITSLERAIRHGLPGAEKTNAFISMGYAWIKLGKLPEAEKAFKNALRINPEDYHANRALGELYLKLEKPQLAERFLEKAARLHKNMSTQQSLAVALEKQKKYRDALEALLQIEKSTRKGNPQLLAQIATLYSKSGNHKMAARYFLKAFDASKRTDYELLFKAAMSNLESNNLASAISLMKKYVEKSGASGEQLGLAHSRLAIMYLKKGNSREAIRHFKKALALNVSANKAASIHLQLGFLYLRLDEPSKAVSHFSKVLDQRSLGNEMRLKALLGMATSQVRTQNFSSAERQLRKALVLARNRKDRTLILRQLVAIKLKEQKYAEARHYLALLLTKRGGSWIDRLNFGYALEGLGQHQEAIDEFFRAYRMRKSPEILLAVANSYYSLKKPGIALHYLREAELSYNELKSEKQFVLFEQLGYLALQEGSLSEAEKALRKALSLKDSANARLYLGIVEAKKGAPEKAIQILTRGNWKDFTGEKQVLRKKTLAKCYSQIGEFEKSRALWEEVAGLTPDAEAWFQLGKVNSQIGDHHQALQDFQKAVQLDRNSIYLSAYGHELHRNGRLTEAIEVFKESLLKDPDQIRLYPDLAYLYMQTYQNDDAVKQFKHAIDYLPLNCFVDPDCQTEVKTKREKYRREITAITKKFSLTAWDAFVAGDTGTVKKGSLGGGDQIVARGTMGFEASWVVPKIGFRDYKVLEAIARTTVNLEEDSLDPDTDSWQGAVGFRYKPFKRLKFKVGMERLFSLGDDSEDNWLVRGLYDWSNGYELNPVKTDWNYSYLYSEIDYYFPHRDRMLWYGELRQGWSFKVLPKLVLTPHLIVDGIWYTPDRDDSSFVEGGIGISGKYFWGGTSYLTDHHSIELLTYYKRGELTAGGVDDRKISGFFATLIISY